MTFLITGGCGFLGSNIAAHLLGEGERVVVLDNLSGNGSERNLEWLRRRGTFDFIKADVRHLDHVADAIQRVRPSAIYHLAGQVAMTTSLRDPRLDFDVNVGGSINILEAVRAHAPEAAIVFSSSNKVYGDLATVPAVEEPLRYSLPDYPRGLDERLPLDFHTPYGCSKGAADQYMLDYARMFGLNTVVFRHSTIYGGRQFATYDQGWIGWFCQKALEQTRGVGARFTISGNGKQVRDLLHVDDAIRCYVAAFHRLGTARGQAFNIGGGMENSSSLLELFEFLERRLSVSLDYECLPMRASDQRVFVADTRKACAILGWHPTVTKEIGIERTLEWTQQAAG
jgi:CDP-paratose 2-epimerase